jgi:NADH dehydrogenase
MQNVTIFGGSGFIGSYLVRELAKSQYNIRIVSRNIDKASELKLCGNLGQITPVCGNVFNKGDIERNIQNADIVINLVGILNEAENLTFDEVHHKVPELMAKIAKQNNVKKFIHFSALITCNGTTKYGASKLKGELAVKQMFSDAIIIKPSVVFGEEDNFFNLFAKIATKFRMLPLINGGRSLMQPIYVGDIAKFIKIIVDNDDIKNQSYVLVGPKKYSMKELMIFIKDTLNIRCLLIPIPYFLAMIKGWSLELKIWKPFNKFITGNTSPILTRDQVKMLNYDNVSDEKTLYDFGFKPKSIEEIVPIYLKAFYSH